VVGAGGTGEWGRREQVQNDQDKTSREVVGSGERREFTKDLNQDLGRAGAHFKRAKAKGRPSGREVKS